MHAPRIVIIAGDLVELLRVYPDARIVFMHRDPLEVIPSTGALTASLRSSEMQRLANEFQTTVGNIVDAVSAKSGSSAGLRWLGGSRRAAPRSQPA